MTAAADDAGPWTILRLLTWTQAHFLRHGLDSPRLCAEVLLAHVLQCERIHLYTRHDQAPDETALGAFRELVRQAAAGRPIAYLVGRKEFFSLPFEVGPDVFIPRPETEILVERTIDLARRAPAPPAILDLCTGSGCIAVCLAKHLKDARLFASDISQAALTVARRNAERHGVADRIEFRCGDLFEPWRTGIEGKAGAMPAPFDLIVCNPPYVATQGAPVAPNVRDFEPHLALFAGPDGLDIVRRILAAAPSWLAGDGHLLLELAFDQAPTVRGLLAAAPWRNVSTYRDGAGHERVVHARRLAAGCAQVA